MASLSASPPARLLIVPGLNDSGPAHWQSWLQARHPGAVRVTQRDWGTPDVERWSARIGSVLARNGEIGVQADILMPGGTV